MHKKSILKTTAISLGLICGFVIIAGCKTDPLNFARRNACEFLNCDVLFFVDDILPLSGGPVSAGDGDGDAEEGGGH